MTIKGKTLTLDQWSARTGIKRSTIANRIARGWTSAQAVELERRPVMLTGPARKLSIPGACPHCGQELQRIAA